MNSDDYHEGYAAGALAILEEFKTAYLDTAPPYRLSAIQHVFEKHDIDVKDINTRERVYNKYGVMALKALLEAPGFTLALSEFPRGVGVGVLADVVSRGYVAKGVRLDNRQSVYWLTSDGKTEALKLSN